MKETTPKQITDTLDLCAHALHEMGSEQLRETLGRVNRANSTSRQAEILGRLTTDERASLERLKMIHSVLLSDEAEGHREEVGPAINGFKARLERGCLGLERAG